MCRNGSMVDNNLLNTAMHANDSISLELEMMVDLQRGQCSSYSVVVSVIECTMSCISAEFRG